MAQYTINTTAGEETALDYALLVENTRRAREVPPLPQITKSQLVPGMFRLQLDRSIDEMRAHDRNLVSQAFNEAPNATKDQVRTLLGVTFP